MTQKKQLKCSSCGEEVTKNKGKMGKRYIIRSKPIICNICVQAMFILFEEIEYPECMDEDNIENNKENNKKKQENNILKLNELITKVKATVKGQDEKVDKIVTSIYRNLYTTIPDLKSNLIIIGKTGVGKTEIIKCLKNILGLPYTIEDATRYTEEGYVGESIDSMLKNLYDDSGGNIELAQRGFIIIDEGDKKAGAKNNGRDISGEMVLNSMLKILEGTVVNVRDSMGRTVFSMDTSFITFIFMGAFPGLESIRKKRLNKMAIGFSSENDKIDKDLNYTADDFEKSGIPKEFGGRFDTIVELNTLTTKDYIDIIKNSDKSMFKLNIQDLNNKGVKVEYTEDVIEEIAEEAQKSNFGARDIRKVVVNMFSEIVLKVLSESKYTKCIITKETVHDNTKYILE